MSEALVRSHAWATSPLGPIESWPRTLRGYVDMVMAMPSPAIIFWGPDQLQIYNEGYAVIMGPRHPVYFGAPYRECWPDTYPVAYPWMQEVLAGGTKSVEQQHFMLTRKGFAEEAYFTFTFSPLRDDDGVIRGILQPVVEVTDIVLAERRSATLRDLSPRFDPNSAVVTQPFAALAANDKDIPFALVYRRDGEMTLVAHTGIAMTQEIDARWRPVAERVLASMREELVDDVEGVLGQPHIGTWGDPTQRALVLPIIRSGTETLGAIVLGISPRLELDASYHSFLEGVAGTLCDTFAAERATRVEHELLAREQAARQEAELQKANLSSLFTQAPTPMVVLRGPSMTIELANPPACQLWGRTHDQVVNKTLYDALPEIREQGFHELLQQVYTTGVPYLGQEFPTRLGDGMTHPVRDVYLTFVYSPLRSAAGEVDGVLVLAFDVTAQVRAREQVDSLRSAAESANRAKDHFLAVLGHELRNPLAPIIAAVDLMKAQPIAAPLKSKLEIIERQAGHMTMLVNDLLDLSRIARGQIELQRTRVDIARVVADVVEAAQPLLAQHEHALTVMVPWNALFVDGDANRLAQVLSNLVTNAAKYTPKGGRITISAERHGDLISLHVRDTGIGIEADMLPRIFEMFVQEPQALDRSHGGLGLGLSIVKSLVELHGGTVEARSEGRGRGSEISVTIPAAPGAPATASGADKLGGFDRSQRVLIVDDNEDAAFMLSELLSALGCTTQIAHDGPQALQLASQQKPQVAVLDIGLPGMDGFELARRLRTEHGDMHLIAVTGYGQRSDRTRSFESGFEAHLVKPVSVDQLRSLLRKMFTRVE